MALPTPPTSLWRRSLLTIPLTTMGAAPLFLLSAFAPVLEKQGLMDVGRLGLYASSFFAASAVSYPMVGRWVDGRRLKSAMLVAASWASACLALLPWAVGRPVLVAGVLVFAGIGNCLCQSSSNSALATMRASGRQGTLFGMKQSGVTAASLLAGLAVAPFARGDAWKAAFLLAAATSVVVGLALLRTRFVVGGESRNVASLGRRGSRWPKDAAMRKFALAGAAGAGGATAIGVFLPAWAVANDWSPSAAGALLAIASLGCIAARVGVGCLVDFRQAAPTVVMVRMLGVGAAGVVLVALGGSIPVILSCAVLLAFGAGWGWPGMMMLAVVRANPKTPAEATGIVQGAAAAGAVAVPPVFGAAAGGESFGAAWLGIATLLAGSALLLAKPSRSTYRAKAGKT